MIDSFNGNVLIPFPSKTAMHWWSALFVYLHKSHSFVAPKAENGQILDRAYVKYFRFQQPLQNDITAVPLQASVNYRPYQFSILENADTWEQFLASSPGRNNIQQNITLLVSLENELEKLNKRTGLSPMLDSCVDSQYEERGVETYRFRLAPAIEWIAQLIEHFYQHRSREGSAKLNFPLRVLVACSDDHQDANQALVKSYTGLVRRYLRAFFQHPYISTIQATLKEKPAREDIESLADKMEFVIKALLQTNE